MLTIDVHTHLLPADWPDFAERFGYGRKRFVWPEPGHDNGKPCIRMMRGIQMFRRVWPSCYDPEAVLEDCAKNEVDVQVVCTVPVMFSYWTKPEHGLEISRLLNDHLAEVVRAYPKRFIALGTVPMQDTDLAIAELERCKSLGMPGVQIGSHIEPNAFTGRDYDLNLSDPKLFPFFEACRDLGMAVLVHPWEMMGADQMNKYWLPWLVGMPAETTRAICSMIFGGVFEKLPGLRVCFAHGGGSFPLTIGRIEHGYNCRPDLVAVDNPVNPREYLRKGPEEPARFWVDSIVHDRYALRTLVGVFGVQRICMGSDYPFPLGEVPGELIRNNPAVTPDAMAMLMHRNTLEFLGVDGGAYSPGAVTGGDVNRAGSVVPPGGASATDGAAKV